MTPDDNSAAINHARQLINAATEYLEAPSLFTRNMLYKVADNICRERDACRGQTLQYVNPTKVIAARRRNSASRDDVTQEEFADPMESIRYWTKRLKSQGWKPGDP